MSVDLLVQQQDNGTIVLRGDTISFQDRGGNFGYGESAVVYFEKFGTLDGFVSSFVIIEHWPDHLAVGLLDVVDEETDSRKAKYIDLDSIAVTQRYSVLEGSNVYRIPPGTTDAEIQALILDRV